LFFLLANISCSLVSKGSPTEIPLANSAVSSTATPLPKAEPANLLPETVFDNLNTQPVASFPPQPANFTLTENWRITKILVLHWNNGKGAPPGQISIQQGDTTYGPWQAAGVASSGGDENTYWMVKPNLELAPGTYTFIDSDPATQSYNEAAGNIAMLRIMGIRLGFHDQHCGRRNCCAARRIECGGHPAAALL
jgi:hypothetical protein